MILPIFTALPLPAEIDGWLVDPTAVAPLRAGSGVAVGDKEPARLGGLLDVEPCAGVGVAATEETDERGLVVDGPVATVVGFPAVVFTRLLRPRVVDEGRVPEADDPGRSTEEPLRS